MVPCLGCSSVSTTFSPFLTLMVTGTISSANVPSFCARSALPWDAAAKASCWSRVICHRSATFSAVFPMW